MCSRFLVMAMKQQTVQTQFSSGGRSPLLSSPQMVSSSKWVAPIREDEGSYKIGKLAGFVLSRTNPGFVFVCFIFTISMVLKSFSCSSNNQRPLLVLRTNELKMTKMTVFFVNWKTYVSQLSGSAIGFLLPTKSAFKVHSGKGNSWLFVRSKGVFIPLDKDLSKNSSYTCSGSATGSIHTNGPTFFLVQYILV